MPRFHRIDGCFARAAPPRIEALDCFSWAPPRPEIRSANFRVGRESTSLSARAGDRDRFDDPADRPTWLLPIHSDLPLLVSAGGYVAGSGQWGWEPGLAAELFWGSHSYNYHSFYALDAGLFAGGRYSLGASRDVTVLAGLRLDLELIALPFLLVWGAIRGGDPAR